jgi:hypothetical protein
MSITRAAAVPANANAKTIPSPMRAALEIIDAMTFPNEWKRTGRCVPVASLQISPSAGGLPMDRHTNDQPSSIGRSPD